MGFYSDKAEELLTEYRAMCNERALVDSFYQAASRLFDPLNARYWDQNYSGNRAPNWNGDVFTGAGINSLHRLSNFLLGNGTPANSRWLSLTDSNPDIVDQEDVAQFWADSTSIISEDMSGYAGMQSSFYIAMRDAYRSMGISYGVVNVGEYKFNGRPTGHVFYEPVMPHSFWYRLGAHGEMVSGAYMRQMTDDQAQGFMARNVHKVVGELDKAMRSTTRRNILQMVKFNPNGKDQPRRASEYLFEEFWIDVADRKILMHTGYNSQPFHVIGWDKIPGSHYYVGPAYYAMPDLSSANAAKKSQLQVMAWEGRPPLLAGSKDGFDNPQKTLVPGRITFGAVNFEGKQLIQPLNNGSNSGVFQYSVAEDEARVKELMMNNELLSTTRPNMTATEAMQIAQERAQMVAPFMITTLPAIKGMVQRHFEIMLRLGRLPPVPDAVLAEGGFDAVVSGPMARAARQSEIGSVFETLQQIGMVAQFDPSAARRLDIEEITNMIGEANGTIHLLHEWDKVQRDMKAEAEMNAAMAQAEIDKQNAEAADKSMSAVNSAVGMMQ